MDGAFKSGVGFGLTSGVITTLGLMIGLAMSSNSKEIVLAGILTIAFADALSDALGVHISKEAEGKPCPIVWKSTGWTFIFKLIVALTFIVPVLFFSLGVATIISIVWGILILGTFSFLVGKWEHGKPWKVVAEHLLIAIIVVVLSYYIGRGISKFL